MKLDKRSKFRYCKNWVQILTVCGVTFSSLQRGKQRGTESRNAWHSWQIVWFPYSRFIFLSLVSQLGALGLCCGTFELLHCSTQPLFFGRSTILQVSLCHALPSLSMLLCLSSIPLYLSGLIHPYWSRINSEKTCPLMVFWNLSVWAFNGAENWIVPKDCWAKKMSVGGIFCGAVLYWQIIETASTAPFTRLTLSSLDNGLGRISVAPNFIGRRFVTSDIWPFEKFEKRATNKFVLFMLHEKDSLCMLAPCQGSLSEH